MKKIVDTLNDILQPLNARIDMLKVPDSKIDKLDNGETPLVVGRLNYVYTEKILEGSSDYIARFSINFWFEDKSKPVEEQVSWLNDCKIQLFDHGIQTDPGWVAKDSDSDSITLNLEFVHFVK